MARFLSGDPAHARSKKKLRAADWWIWHDSVNVKKQEGLLLKYDQIYKWKRDI